MKRVVVLGGGFAGILSAGRLGRALSDVETTLVSASDDFVEKVRWHQVATGQPVRRYPIGPLLRGSRARFVRATVTGIDLARREVQMEGGDPLAYDQLVYALGSVTERERVAGVVEHAESLAGVEAAEALARRLEALPSGARVTVCGGGLTGIELATEIAESRPTLEVSLVTAGAFASTFSDAGRAYLRKTLARLGVAIHENARVREVRAGSLRLEGNHEVAFDACAWVASFTVPRLARDSGLAVNEGGQVLVDETMRSVSHPEVFAAGDAANLDGQARFGLRMGCATAMPMAAFASNNLARVVRGQPLEPFRFLYAAQFASLGRRDALAQYVHADDSPRTWISTGRFAAFLKELTFRMNVFSLRTGFYPLEALVRMSATPTLALGGQAAAKALPEARPPE